MKNLIIILTALCLHGCSTPYLENSLVWNELPSETIYLVSSDEVSGDSRTHNAFIKELKERGFNVIDMQDKMPESNDGIILKYKETWGWDLVMVISTIDVRLIDGRTKNTIGTSYWGRGFFHNYPSPDSAVSQLLDEMNIKYVAGKNNRESLPTDVSPQTNKTCTTEQILKMKEIGMTDDQIKGACN